MESLVKYGAVVIAVIGAIMYLSTGSGMFSAALNLDNFRGPELRDCVRNQQGHITSCTVNDEITDVELPITSTQNNKIWIHIAEVEPEPEIPYLTWLCRNKPSLIQEQEDGCEYYNVKLTSSVLNSLEQASTATFKIDLSSHGEFLINTTKTRQYYDDEPDCFGDYCGENTWRQYFDNQRSRFAGEFMQQPVTVHATKLRFTDNAIYAQVNLAEIINKGMELPGQFISWEGREPIIAEEGGSTSVQITFSLDSDGDYVMDAEDAFPQNEQCIRDSDSDGRCDARDAFPRDASFVDDIDGDRRPDSTDLCSTRRGSTQFAGCPGWVSYISEKYVSPVIDGVTGVVPWI
ncbi:MAG: hypothetical protein SVU32_08000 [Candidatus Nanohaloarchaea archaeon]|nr:hypothetical protein [Candidatus Nanohaloarchaea archaeon]